MDKVSYHTKCISLNNETCIARPTLIDLNLEEFHYYQLMVTFDGCNGSFNTHDSLSSRICVRNKRQDANLRYKII